MIEQSALATNQGAQFLAIRTRNILTRDLTNSFPFCKVPIANTNKNAPQM